MKKFRLTKVTAGALVAISMMALNPIGASAQWRQDNNGWWYAKGSSWSQGWDLINSNWYYFGSDGYMHTGWIKDGENWYYLYANGKMAANTTIDGYKVDVNGVWQQLGWRKDSKGWYYVKKDGSRETGSRVTSSAPSGWATIDSKKYLFGSDGYMKTGWAQVGDKWYYLNQSGEKAVDTVIDGYTIDLNGVRIDKPTQEEEAARNAILKEDSNYINAKVEDYGYMLLKSPVANLETANIDAIKNKWKITEEVITFNFVDSDDGVGYTYLVGKTSGNVYALPTQGFYPAYQIKDNQIVKTFEWNGDGAKNISWRNNNLK